jgi:hypothetical protein
MTRRTPDPERTSARVSPTAPDTHSASTNVWRLIETQPDFAEGMEQARREHDAGAFKPFRRKNPRQQS